MNCSELLDSSDSSDEDYVPDKKSEISGTDSDRNVDLSGSEETSTLSRKRKKSKVKSRKRQKYIESNISPENVESEQLSNDEKKKIEEDIWADFMRDTGFKSRNDRLGNIHCNKAESETFVDYKLKEATSEKVKITQTFEFAGENVTVEKEVPKSSGDRLLTTTKKNIQNDKSKCKSGISGILNQLGKKQKISTLEKSKLDWDQFKKEENLEEELQTHNRGKDGYLEKQDFLERADLRRFEIEREIRTIERSKRVNHLS